MEEEILKQIKKEYKKEKKEKERCQSIQDRIDELKENPYVQEYLTLINKSKEIDMDYLLDKTEQQMIMSAFNQRIYEIKETNKIYVYLGTYQRGIGCDIEHGVNDYRVFRYDEKADYVEYRDLESRCSIEIPINDAFAFEKNNHIIIPDTFLTENYYYRLQECFIEDLVKNGQKKAVCKILKKCKSNTSK